jgi:hypothetical protein
MESYRRHWEQRFDRLNEYLKSIDKTRSPKKGVRHARRSK